MYNGFPNLREFDSPVVRAAHNCADDVREWLTTPTLGSLFSILLLDENFSMQLAALSITYKFMYAGNKI